MLLEFVGEMRAPAAGWPRVKAFSREVVGVRQVIHMRQQLRRKCLRLWRNAAHRDAAEADAVVAALAPDEPHALPSPRAR